MFKSKRTLCLTLLAIPAAVLLGCSVHTYMANRSFVNFTNQMFQEEITGNTLNLHYTLSDPETYGIKEYPITLGSGDAATAASSCLVLENYQKRLDGVCRHCLSDGNRLTYDILSAYLKNQDSGKDFYLYSEPLGPTIGTQAQLPVLLAEYNFRNERDIQDYIGLVSQMDAYYSSLLDFEKAKAEAGLFMSDASADAIIAQCRTFIANPEENFMLDVFNENMDACKFLSDSQKTAYKSENKAAVLNHVVPAYQLLIDGLTQLKGSGTNEKGLCYLPDGKAYYEYLVRETTGTQYTVPDLTKRIQKQLQADYDELRTLIKENPSLLTSSVSTDLSLDTPVEMVQDLQGKISQDFPSPPAVDCQIKYVHKSLEDFLSPAFYLTPPLDNLKQNVIYINQAASYTPLELYTTLAHEGYPGHLYQTICSGSVPANKVRSLLNFGGYTEGWATYVEMYAYGLADTKPETAALYRLNRSIMLGISSLMDIAIHYYGYSRADTAAYLIQLGFSDASVAESIYDTMLEAPANYLKYYVGCLSFMDLRDAYKEQMGDQFSLKEYHQKVLEIGPAPFTVLEEQLIEK